MTVSDDPAPLGPGIRRVQPDLSFVPGILTS